MTMDISGDPETDTRQYLDDEYARLYEWSDIGIDISDLEILIESDRDRYDELKHRIMKYQLEGMMPEDINSVIFQEISGIVPDLEGEEPILIGSPLDNFDSEIDEDIDIDLDEIEGHNNVVEQIVDPARYDVDNVSDEAEPFPDGIEIEPSIEEHKIKNENKRKNVRKRSLFIGAGMVVVIMILTAGSIFYLLNMDTQESNGKMDPSFQISNEVPLEGTLLTLESKDVNLEFEHQWKINPDSYIIFDGEYNSNNLTLYFRRSGNYSIEHIIESGETKKSSIETLEVSPRTVRVNRESYGDTSSYRVNGKMTMENVENILDIPESIDFRNLEMDFKTAENNPQTISISSDPFYEKDGYGKSYEQIKRVSNERLHIIGSIMDKNGVKIPFSGTSELQQDSMIDLYLKKPVKSSIHHESSIVIAFSPISKTYDLAEDYEMYPILSRDYQELRVEDISDDRTFNVGDEGVTIWGSYSFEWEAVNVDLFNGIPCMNLSLTLDPYTRERLDIDTFIMNLWVAQSYPVALRTEMYVSSQEDAYNAYTLDYIQNLVEFESGDDPIIYGTVESSHAEITDIIQIWPDLSLQFHDDFKYAPRQGNLTSSIPHGFDAETAISEFEDSTLFKNFVRNLDDPYCLVTNITKGHEGLDKYLWKFTISEEDQTWGFNQTVVQDSSLSAGSQVRIKMIPVSKSDLSEILTYSGAEESLKRIMGEIDDDVLRDLYGVPEPGSSHSIDLEDHSLMTVAARPYPSIGMINPSIIESIPYCMVIKSLDNTFEMGLDMCSGQVCYLHYKSVNYD